MYLTNQPHTNLFRTINMNITEKFNAAKLKVKALSLAEEARIIRKLEKQFNKETYVYREQTYQYHNELYDHRVGIVRWESRATHLARAFLAGKDYKSIEPSRKPEKEYYFNIKVEPRVQAIIKKYKRNSSPEQVTEWLQS